MSDAISFFDLDALPRRQAMPDGEDCFEEVFPVGVSSHWREDLALPAVLSETEVGWVREGPMPVRPIGWYQVGNVDVLGRAYALRGDAVCYSPSTVPKYWRELLEANPKRVPDRRQFVVRQVERPVALFVSRDYNNYGHWWLDIVPRLFFLWRHRPELFKELSFVVPRDLSAWGRDVLSSLFGIETARLEFYDAEREMLRCRSAIIPTMLHTHYFFHSRAEDFYGYVSETCAPNSTDDKRNRFFYLTRRNFAKRAGKAVRLMTNAEPAEALAASMGFEIVAPEEMSWREQVALFSRATVVAGEHGSAMKNLLFAPRGSVAVIINWLNNTQCNIAALKGQHCMILGTEGFDLGNQYKPFSVDLEKLRACLGRALQSAV